MAERELPEWVVGHVCAVARGYELRRAYLARYSSSGNLTARMYLKYNAAIDRVLEEVCAGEAEGEAVRRSLIDGYTWERIPDCPCGRRRFYELKREVIYRLAQELNVF